MPGAVVVIHIVYMLTNISGNRNKNREKNTPMEVEVEKIEKEKHINKVTCCWSLSDFEQT